MRTSSKKKLDDYDEEEEEDVNTAGHRTGAAHAGGSSYNIDRSPGGSSAPLSPLSDNLEEHEAFSEDEDGPSAERRGLLRQKDAERGDSFDGEAVADKQLTFGAGSKVKMSPGAGASPPELQATVQNMMLLSE